MTTKNWSQKIEKRLCDFYRELDAVCKSAGRERSSIEVIFATKYLNPEQFVIFIHILEHFGKQIVLGENKVQDAQKKIGYLNEKKPQLRKTVRYVMVGNLQKNKINRAIEIFDEIHSLDSLELAEAVNRRLETIEKKMTVFWEVNVSGEESKHGVRVDQVDLSLRSLRLLKSLKLEGLMTIAPFYDDPERTRPVFRVLKLLADKHNLKTSMGMSNDWKQAVEEGADIIRIGSRIFS